MPNKHRTSAIALLKFIIAFVEKEGFQPSFLEMARGLSVKQKTICLLLDKLVEIKIIEDTREERAIKVKFVRFHAVFHKP